MIRGRDGLSCLARTRDRAAIARMARRLITYQKVSTLGPVLGALARTPGGTPE